MTGGQRRGPLEGIRVVELATVIMAPYATQLLGDLGATVVKVETGRGDGSRVMGGGPHPELSGIALNLHRNKRSIGLDLKVAEGRAVLLRLLEDCDVFVTNLRPGPLARLSLDYESLEERFPSLVYCQAQGFRTDSEEAGRPAYDDIIQALAGFPQLNGMAWGETRFMPSILADKVAGMMISQGALAALVARGATGRGQRVEVPMFDAALAFNLVEHLGRAAVPGEPAGYNRVLTPHRGPHRTTDGFVAMMPYTDDHWTRLFAAVGAEDLLERPCFADHRSRLMCADEVYGLLAEIVSRRTTAEWLALCHEHGIPVSPVPSLQEIVDDPVHHRGVLREVEHPVTGTYREIAQPLIFSDAGEVEHRPAPLRAEDSMAVLVGAGYTPGEIEALVAVGAVDVGTAPAGTTARDVTAPSSVTPATDPVA